ncbi:MAG: TIM barrel protein [Candidatus Hinthialibacter antarcticus]|nr:TIM barrel protein [Candidatus Hinthialibacter antarcticus]
MTACFHPSIEGAQHGAKSLDEFLAFAKASGAAGAQPSNFMLEDGKGGFKPASEVKDAFAKHGLAIDGISSHCPFWVHTSAWTGTKSIRPFIPGEVAKKSLSEIEQWAEDYILKFMDYAAELGVKVLPMFWGVAFGWELASGYPWGFWAGPDFDLIKEGQERFVTKTAKIREKANSLGAVLCHEIHPGTGAMCADDFLMLVDICGGDASLGVNVDPSHCWEGESWETRFLKVAQYCYGCHIKNHTIRPDFPLRMMESGWQKRGMQFVDLPSGDINMVRFAELMITIGYPELYKSKMGTATAPLVVEAESAHRDVDACSANGIAYVRDNCCFPVAAGSFEDGIGAD